MKDGDITRIRSTINSANINFLVGAGLSADFLSVLGDIEEKIDHAERTDNKEDGLKWKRKYFKDSMVGNIEIISDKDNNKKDGVLDDYKNFYKTINLMLLAREMPVLTKQVNIFTTNIDVFSEKALEEIGIDFNDGFHGRFRPRYSLGNFKKSYLKTSLHYENTSEIPVFNVMKLHGSLSWRKGEDDEIYFDHKLDLVRKVEGAVDSTFEDQYEKLLIVNAPELKAAYTVINQLYYDLLRAYSNELEKENSVLFVMGFSFNDRHIYDITLRVANSNPTLKVFIFNHGCKLEAKYKRLAASAKNNNIEVLCPGESGCDQIAEYNLATITDSVFKKVLNLSLLEPGSGEGEGDPIEDEIVK